MSNTNTRIRADKMFDGTQMLSNVLVEVRDGRIVNVDVNVAPSIEADVYRPGCTLIPGLIDTHTHIMWDSSDRPEEVLALERPERSVLRAAHHALLHLLAGETTIRDLGAPGGLSVPLAAALENGEVRGSRLIPAGRAIAMTGGHGWTLCVEADGADGVRAATRMEIKNGARAIKLMASGGVYGKNERPENPQLSRAEVRAAIEEAHNSGCLVAAHAYAPSVINMLLDEGADSIEHGSLLDEPTAERMSNEDVFLVPTLSVFNAIYESCGDDRTSEIALKAAEVREASLKACGLAASKGVPLAVGTDSGAPGNPHGSVAKEAGLMVEGGASTLIALKAATSEAARAIGMQGIVGEIRPGLEADLVLVGGDPLEDIGALRDIRFVMLRGVTESIR